MIVLLEGAIFWADPSARTGCVMEENHSFILDFRSLSIKANLHNDNAHLFPKYKNLGRNLELEMKGGRAPSLTILKQLELSNDRMTT